MPKFTVTFSPRTKSLKFDMPITAFQQYVDGKEPDVEVPINLSEEDFNTLARAAHKLGLTFDHFVERCLVDAILKTRYTKKSKRITSKAST